MASDSSHQQTDSSSTRGNAARRLALLVSPKGDASLAGYADVIEALGHHSVTTTSETGLIPLIRRLAPDVVIISPRKVVGTALKIGRLVPAVKLIVAPSYDVHAVDTDTPAPRGAPLASLSKPDKLLYSRKDAAYALSISQRSLDTLIASKKLATRRLGRKVMIPASEARRLARENTYHLDGTL